MSIKDGRDYLYLIWKDEKSRKQYIVAQLSKNGQYEFEYKHEVNEAQKHGFELLVTFPDTTTVYKNDILFPVFSSRLPDGKRKDIGNILKKHGLTEYDEYSLLKRSGARLPIDNLEFIDPILDKDEDFERIFYLAGSRHYINCSESNCNKAMQTNVGDELVLQLEQTNLHDSNAIEVFTKDNIKLGYIPRYYCEGVSELIKENIVLTCVVLSLEYEHNCRECIKVKLYRRK